MAGAASALRSLDSVPGLGRLFLFTARQHLTKALFTEGHRNPRMFRMWMGPKPMIVATHPEVARAVLTRPKDFIKAAAPDVGFRRIDAVLNKTSGGKNANLVAANGEEWAAMRKPLDPAFEKNALRNVVPQFVEASDKLIAHWSTADVVDAKRDMSRFALDVLGSAVLGRSFNALDGGFDETYSRYQFVMREMMNPLYMVFPRLEKVPLPRNLKYRADFEHMRDVLQGAVEARIQERKERQLRGEAEGEPRDMLDLLLGPGLNPHGVLEEGYLLPILWIFFIAGHDTTAISLTWLMQVMAIYPEIQARAREEAISVLNGASDPTPEMLDQVPYISAIISEGLRLRPPVFNLITRETAHDTELDGVAVPKGTGVSIHIGAINRHPEVWERAGEFDPERFMQAKQPRVFHNLPFSAGPRRCLGDKFSLMEQKTLLIKLLSQLEVLPTEVTAEEPPYSNDMGILFFQPQEMKVKIRPLSQAAM